MKLRRRHFLQLSGGTALAIAIHGCTQPQSKTPTGSSENPGKISMGFWPVASGLPLFVAEKKCRLRPRSSHCREKEPDSVHFRLEGQKLRYRPRSAKLSDRPSHSSRRRGE